ncbi:MULTISPECIES: AI-2E family transporter [Vibrio]|uniref:AI-2E family transporter n=1 Tax=Vibrio casei TaxID=673372 RepID=A0A368LL39_9VIBR|nr:MULTISPECIES: AI-2E family transporter [Vibrio]RCS72548.1 AI-2E family transporter [Vibrio casei]SJN36061.1 Predicted permease [Vibrio casei]HBV75105.1 AI-2E family transporter [Vibrio sp.]
MPNKFKVSSTHWVLIIALLCAAYACYLLITPYLNSIIMAFIISLLIYPLHEKIEQRWPKCRNLTSLLSCLLLTFVIVIPLLAIFAAIIQQGAHFSQTVYAWATDGGIQTLLNHPYVAKGLNIINHYLPFDNINPQEIAQRAAKFISQFGSILVSISASILGDATHFLMNFFLMLFVLFFLLRDNEKLVNSMRHILPLSRSQEDRLLSEIKEVSKSAILGSFLTAIAQALAGGFALWLVGLPGLFWGTMMGAASFIPVVGTALVWVPAAIYLILTGDIGWAIFLIVWGVAVIGSIDNIIRPLLMQSSAGMDTLMIFFALLGGIQLFGLIGLIYGPLIFAITIVLFKMYEEEFKAFLTSQDNN